jgi:hypothetical protein
MPAIHIVTISTTDAPYSTLLIVEDMPGTALEDTDGIMDVATTTSITTTLATSACATDGIGETIVTITAECVTAQHVPPLTIAI